MDYNLYNFCFRTFVLIYRFVGMVFNSGTTGKSTYNCYCYDGNTCYQRHYTVLDKKKVKILGFQAYLICAIKFKTPILVPKTLRFRDFSMSFLPVLLTITPFCALLKILKKLGLYLLGRLINNYRTSFVWKRPKTVEYQGF